MKRIPYYLIMILLAACASTGPAPDDHYYRLPPASAASGQAPLTEGTVFVEQLIADGIYRERSILYSSDSGGLELSRYHYQHWVDTPSRLIRDQLIDYLRTTHEASQVVSVVDVPAQLSIYGRIRHFERRVTSSGVTVVVALEFRVNSDTSESPVLLREYSRSEEIDDASIPASVTVFANLLDSIFGELVADIRNIETS